MNDYLIDMVLLFISLGGKGLSIIVDANGNTREAHYHPMTTTAE